MAGSIVMENIDFEYGSFGPAWNISIPKHGARSLIFKSKTNPPKKLGDRYFGC